MDVRLIWRSDLSRRIRQTAEAVSSSSLARRTSRCFSQSIAFRTSIDFAGLLFSFQRATSRLAGRALYSPRRRLSRAVLLFRVIGRFVQPSADSSHFPRLPTGDSDAEVSRTTDTEPLSIPISKSLGVPRGRGFYHRVTARVKLVSAQHRKPSWPSFLLLAGRRCGPSRRRGAAYTAALLLVSSVFLLNTGSRRGLPSLRLQPLAVCSVEGARLIPPRRRPCQARSPGSRQVLQIV